MIMDSEKSLWKLRGYNFGLFTCTELHPTTLRHCFYCGESKTAALKYLRIIVFIYISRKSEKKKKNQTQT